MPRHEQSAASAHPGAHTVHFGTEDKDPLNPQGSLLAGVTTGFITQAGPQNERDTLHNDAGTTGVNGNCLTRAGTFSHPPCRLQKL